MIQSNNDNLNILVLVSMILVVGVWHLPSVDTVTEFDSAFEVIGAAVTVLAAAVADLEDSVADSAVAVLLADTIDEVSVEIVVVVMVFGSEISFSINVVCGSLLFARMFYDKIVIVLPFSHRYG